jgi:hypothetical protein
MECGRWLAGLALDEWIAIADGCSEEKCGR